MTTKGAANPKERNFRPTPKDHNQLSTWTTPKLLRDKTNKGQTTAWAEIHTNGVPKEAIYTDKPGHWMIDFWHPEVTAEKLVNSIIRTGVVQAREQRYPRK